MRRLSGARSRAEARKDGRDRDHGIAAKKQRRKVEQAERLVVHEIVRRELAEVTSRTAKAEGNEVAA